MPTPLTHLAVPLALACGLGRRQVSTALVAAGLAAAVLPDFDVIAFRLGIAYSDVLGHRGWTHSIAFAALLGMLAAAAPRGLRASPARAFAFVFVAAASHDLLDALTTGGRGVALAWPWTNERFFAPIRAIRAAPLNLDRLWSERGLAVLASEARWVWLPLAAAAALAHVLRGRRATRR